MNKFEEYLLTFFLFTVACVMCFLAAKLLDMDAVDIIAMTALWGAINNIVKSNNSKK